MTPARILVLSLVLLTAAACVRRAPQTADKGFSEARSTQAELEESFAPRRVALVVGIDDYDDPTFTDLRYARRDATELGDVFAAERHGRFDRVIALTRPEDTTRAAILDELRRLRADLRRQDTFVFYFSGHGTLELGGGDLPDLYLVAVDTRSSDLPGTAIDLAELRDYISQLKPQRAVMILDNCFAGDGKSRTTAAVRERIEGQQWARLEESFGQSEAVLMASTLGGVAREDDELRHGIYTWYLIQALTADRGRADVDGDGGVTAWEAHDYARIRTFERSDEAQIPEARFRFVGSADFYLAGTPSSVDARSAALVYAYGPRVGDGLALSVDGQSKGVFPRTIAVEPGVRRVTVTDAGGRTVADGRLSFAPGQTWSVDELVEEVRGYRRYFGIAGGVLPDATGPAGALWGPVSPSLSLSNGYRLRGGALRGLSLGFELSWMPTFDPAWAGYTAAARRHNVSAGAQMMVRRDVGRIELGGGGFASFLYAPGLALRAEEGLGYGEDLSGLNHSWLTLPVGPLLWGAVPLGGDVRLTVEARGALSLGAVTEAAPALSFQPSLRTGIEVGF